MMLNELLHGSGTERFAELCMQHSYGAVDRAFANIGQAVPEDTAWICSLRWLLATGSDNLLRHGHFVHPAGPQRVVKSASETILRADALIARARASGATQAALYDAIGAHRMAPDVPEYAMAVADMHLELGHHDEAANIYDALLFGVIRLSEPQMAHASAQRGALPDVPSTNDVPMATRAREHSELSAVITEHLAGDNWFSLMRDSMAEVLARRMPAALMRTEAYSETALQTEAQLVRKLKALPPETHVENISLRSVYDTTRADLLHSVFKQDEWMLIALGGPMGFLLGVLQNYVLKRVLI
jgi:hypothetical protein